MLNRSFMVVCLLMVAAITDSFSQNLNIDSLSEMTFPAPGGGIQTLANIGGYVDEDGNEYALVCAEYGLIVVDITDPQNPVDLVQIPGPENEWREVKVYGNYAYVTTEASGTGLQIIDLSPLPQSSTLPSHYWKPVVNGQTLGSIHALHVDTAKGYVYMYGSNLGNGGAYIGDLNSDPYNPTIAGYYDPMYIHDGYVNNDTMFAGEIYVGQFDVVNTQNKSNPVSMAVQSTPSHFTHNTWRYGKNYLLTTDEVDNSFLACYDISDLTDIKETDQIQSNPGSQSIVHNTHVRGDFAITSWYKDGCTIVDISHPDILVQVGNFDTDLSESGGGYGGAWGVYPFFPSGNMVTSNLEGKMMVLGPTYVHASYFKGTITDGSCGGAINNVNVHVVGTSEATTSDFIGFYSDGIPYSGSYDVQFSKAGYQTQTISVNFQTGVVQTVNVSMVALNGLTLKGAVIETGTGTPIPNASLIFDSQNADYEATSDANGHFSICSFSSDTYDIYAGVWGHEETKIPGVVIDTLNDSVTIQLDRGYADDFLFDEGWTVSGNAVTGMWERGDPEGTLNQNHPANPEDDVTNDYGVNCYVTGLAAGGSAGGNDVDGGHTQLTSPAMNLTTYNDPYITFSRWFYNGGGDGSPNDHLTYSISDGVNSYPIDTLSYSSGIDAWHIVTARVLNYAPLLTSNMHLVVYTADDDPGHIVEAAFDKFFVWDSLSLFAPVADFDATPTTACSGEPVQFTDQSQNSPTQWHWSFQGATPDTSNLPNPVVSYSAAGTFDVTLTASNGAGTNSITKSEYIHVFESPVAVPGTVTNESSAGASDGSATLNVSGGATPYTFLWSNGQTDGTATGLTAGTYTATVSDANGCTSEVTINIYVTGIQIIKAENLISVYPNPFSGAATVKYDLSSLHSTHSYLSVVNIIGEEVARIPFTSTAGTLTVGTELHAGVYFISIKTDVFNSSSLKLIKSE